MPTQFFFLPPRFFLPPPRYFFGRKKLVFLGEKNVKICDIGQEKPSDFGEDLSFFFFWRSPAFGRKSCDFDQNKPSDIGEDLFFWRSPAFGRKFCNFGQKKPSHFGKNLCPPDFNFAPRSREAGDAPGYSHRWAS